MRSNVCSGLYYSAYYKILREAMCAFMLYDVTSRESFEGTA